MNLKLLYLVTLWCSVSAYKDYRCNRRSAVNLHRRPIYDFSLQLLQRVSQATDAHFVFSPLSTWVQLIALADGATNLTYKEIKKVTRHYDKKCFKRKLKEVFWYLDKETRIENRKKRIMAIDQFMAVKKDYVRQVQRLYMISVLLLNFQEPVKSAEVVNYAIEHGTGGKIKQILYTNDFEMTVLLMSDANSFHCEWSNAFNPGYTSKQPFLSNTGRQIGYVSMMNQIGPFNVMEFPHIGAQVLELPCVHKAVSLLIFLPTNDKLDNMAEEVFYTLSNTTLSSIFNFYKMIPNPRRLVNVSIPKFLITTEFDNLPELLYDMGIRRIFDPKRAQFNRISNYEMHASLMTQISKIEVNEKGITAGVENMTKNDSCIDFKANRPFTFMVVHKETQFILYAGVYSNPSEI